MPVSGWRFLERADGELMLRYQGEAVDFQEGPPPSSALSGAQTAAALPVWSFRRPPTAWVHSHLNVAQRERLYTLESACSGGGGAQRRQGEASAPPVAPDANVNPAGPLGGCTAGQEQGLSLRAIATNLGMARDTVGKYLKAESPPTKKLSAKEHAKAEALAASSTAAD